jgi:hypothetical protein
MNNSFPPPSLEKKTCLQKKKKKVKEKLNVTPHFNADGTLYIHKDLQSKISEWVIQKKTTMTDHPEVVKNDLHTDQ